jgi:hypothetical protein
MSNNNVDYDDISTFGSRCAMCGLRYLKSDLIFIETDDLLEAEDIPAGSWVCHRCLFIVKDNLETAHVKRIGN